MIVFVISEDDAWVKGLTLPSGFYRTIPIKASGTSVNDAWHMLPTEDKADGFLVITNPYLIGPAV